METNLRQKHLMDNLPTIDIKGKDYVMGVERIRHFRRMFPEGAVQTIIHHLDEKQVIMITRVYPDKKNNPHCFSEGVAQEWIGTKGIKKDSYIELCATSSLGRSLAALGVGIQGSGGIASADEMFGVGQVSNDFLCHTEKQKERYQKLLKHHVFVGRKKDINNWWLTLKTKKEVDLGLEEMQQKIDIYEQQGDK